MSEAKPASQLPEVGRFWIRYAPKSWEAAERPWIHLGGATLGDWLDKPVAQGGLHVSRLYASLILLAFIVVSVALIPQRAARKTEPVT